jgi:hypothetical protein
MISIEAALVTQFLKVDNCSVDFVLNFQMCVVSL